MQNMTRLLGEVLRIPSDVWQAAHLTAVYPIHLMQTCKTVRDAVVESRLPAALCVRKDHISFAARHFNIEAVKLVPNAPVYKHTRYKYAHEAQLIAALEHMPNLTRLDMHDMCMGLYYNNRDFFVALGQCPGLRALTLSCNALGMINKNKDAKLLADMMAQLPELQYLDVSRNNFMTGSVLLILGACKQCPSLTELRLRLNTVSFDWNSNCDIGSVLTTLDLSGCQVADDEISSENDGLHRFLIGCHSLTALNLSDNELTRTHMHAIVDGLQYMTALRSLDVSHNALNIISQRRIRSAWKGDPAKLLV